MSKAHPPELKKHVCARGCSVYGSQRGLLIWIRWSSSCGRLFMDKKLSLKLNGGRHVQGILRGFDPFMNLVIDECVEMATSGQQNNIGMVVIRGNSIIMLEALERV
ncbi:small nuclear ribonucleoprotein G isoform X2 [Microtus pennsylvanicus]|uniref:small nuclear ribonucleoprotein G isoform X2 n=1 Tax=Microtus pennsylvanicus TaxID=10058 RepID=UPI003F6B6744